MKRLLSVIAILCTLALVLCAMGCGSKKPEPATTEAATEAATEAVTEAPTEAPAEETTEAAGEAGELTPSIVIEYGDFDGITALAKDAQNMKVAEGTVAQISGLFSKLGSQYAVMEDGGDGVRKGITLYVDGDWEAPSDYTDIDVIGTFTKGTYVMEFHVLPENITIK